MSTRSSLFFTLSVALNTAVAAGALHSSTALAQSAEEPAAGDAGFVRMRPIDRATVRIFALTGMAIELHESERTGRRRAIAVANAGHGTGVVIDPDGFIVTAAHVVADAQQIAVVMPGGNEGYPADVVYTDPSRDIAILRAGRTFTHFVALPAQQPTVQLGDRIGITGYPLTPHERMPAAASGEISRLTNDGRLQLAAAINPGNSGGPVVDGSGALVGIVSSRLLPQEGAQGIAFIEPIAPAIRAMQNNVRRSRGLEGDRNVRKDLAQVVVATLRSLALGLEADESVINRLVTAIERSEDTDAMALCAAYLWNGITAQLEAANAATLVDLPAEQQQIAVARFGIAIGLARRAVRIDRTIARRYRVAQDLIETGEHLEASLRARRSGASHTRDTTPGEARTASFVRPQRSARTAGDDTHDADGRAVIVSTYRAPEELDESHRYFPRVSLEIGGSMGLDQRTMEPNGGGVYLSTTYDVLRWDASRFASITFASVGGGMHMLFGGPGRFNATITAELGMRLRLGSVRGSSFSVSAHYTPGLAVFGVANESGERTVTRLSGTYAGLRADATLHFSRLFGLGVRFTDQYRPDGFSAIRSAGVTLAFTL
jgi:S1-C subfamily serine protease